MGAVAEHFNFGSSLEVSLQNISTLAAKNTQFSVKMLPKLIFSVELAAEPEIFCNGV